MEPKIEINVIGVDDPLLKRRIKRILKPVLSVLGNRRYEACLLCGTETSWTINNHTVCPICSIKYGFMSKGYDLGSCQVCGRQGEWVCGKDDQHSLCHRHRDAWFDYTKEVPLPRGWDKLPEEEKDATWEKRFNDFIQEMKDKQ